MERCRSRGVGSELSGIRTGFAMRCAWGSLVGTVVGFIGVGTTPAEETNTMKTTNKATLDRSVHQTPATPSTAVRAVEKRKAGTSDGSDGAEEPDADSVDPGVENGVEGGPRRRFKEVWLVEDRREGKSMWTRVGTAFENNDGSFNIRLSALPVAGGRLNMRDPLVRNDEERAERQERQARKVAA